MYRKKLKTINACHAAMVWLADKSSAQAWTDCQRGDWMLWIASKSGVDVRTVTRAKVECAMLVAHLLTDQRSLNALRVAGQYADGLASIQELKSAYASAAHVADSNAAYAAAASAYAVANSYAAHAAAASAYATAITYTDAAARISILAQCADICRQHISLTTIQEFLDDVDA